MLTAVESTFICTKESLLDEGLHSVDIFTCASSRMSHPEHTSGGSTNKFFQALTPMISRGGLCSTIWSHNAKTFKRVDPEVQ